MRSAESSDDCARGGDTSSSRSLRALATFTHPLSPAGTEDGQYRGGGARPINHSTRAHPQRTPQKTPQETPQSRRPRSHLAQKWLKHSRSLLRTGYLVGLCRVPLVLDSTHRHVSVGSCCVHEGDGVGTMFSLGASRVSCFQWLKLAGRPYHPEHERTMLPLRFARCASLEGDVVGGRVLWREVWRRPTLIFVDFSGAVL